MPQLLQDLISTLVASFGVDQVQAAIEKAVHAATSSGKDLKAKRSVKTAPNDRPRLPTIVEELDRLNLSDFDKFFLIMPFYEALKSRKVLADAQDIRHFSQLVGMKRIDGKSRKDLIAPLTRFLINLPTADMQMQIECAPTVSERQRQQGFSILTDNLLGS